MSEAKTAVQNLEVNRLPLSEVTSRHNQIIHGQCPEALKDIPDQYVQTCITSPPYWGLRDYGLDPIVWDGDHECDHEWGHIIPHQKHEKRSPAELLACSKLDRVAGENSAFKWDEKTPKESGSFCRICSAWLGCLGLEPTPELYVEHLVQIFREVKRVLRDDGTLWLNIGDSYAGGNRGGNPDDSPFRKQATNRGSLVAPTPIPPGSMLKPKDMVLIPFRLALALQADGWWVRSDIIWHKPNVMPSSVKDRPTTDYEHVFLLAKSKRYYYDQEAIREPHKTNENRPSGMERQAEQYRAKANRKYTGAPAIVASGSKSMDGHSGNSLGHPNGRNKRTVWTITTKPYKGAHFATFPPDLITPMILAGSAEGDVVLDPFAGSGTTCAVAKAHGRRWIGIESNAEYCELARKRIKQTETQLDIFDNAAGG